MAESAGSRAPAMVWVWWLLLLAAVPRLLPCAEAVWLTVPTSGTKCVSEDIQNNVVVLADYLVVNAHGDVDDHHQGQPEPIATISAKVTSPYGNNLHHKENVTHGQFAFTTKEGGIYMACFWLENKHREGAEVNVSLEWKTGVAAKDWESVARKENIEGLEHELSKLEGVVDSIRENLVYLKNKEAEMREVSEKTNARVAWFSILSLGVAIVVSLWQTWHLQRFFQKKKLI